MRTPGKLAEIFIEAVAGAFMEMGLYLTLILKPPRRGGFCIPFSLPLHSGWDRHSPPLPLLSWHISQPRSLLGWSSQSCPFLFTLVFPPRLEFGALMPGTWAFWTPAFTLLPRCRQGQCPCCSQCTLEVSICHFPLH